jgi:hypothetical protein
MKITVAYNEPIKHYTETKADKGIDVEEYLLHLQVTPS